MKFMIDNFGVSNLFGRENYEFYARITGRILKVEEDWIFSFRYPPDTLVSSEYLLFITLIFIQVVHFEIMRYILYSVVSQLTKLLPACERTNFLLRI